jgi:uncharacterized membrane protein
MRSALAAACLLVVATSTAGAQQGTSLQCAGTEPFWGLTVTAKAMWFTDHDQKRTDLVLVKPRNAIGRQPDALRVYQTRRAKDGAAVTLLVKRNYERCTDNMSEKEHAYDAVYITPEGVYDGCCSWAAR